MGSYSGKRYFTLFFFSLETDIIKYAKNIWTQLQVPADLESEAPDWDSKREKIIEVLQSDKKRFHQFEKNGQRLKLWGLIDPDSVSFVTFA